MGVEFKYTPSSYFSQKIDDKEFVSVAPSSHNVHFNCFNKQHTKDVQQLERAALQPSQMLFRESSHLKFGHNLLRL